MNYIQEQIFTDNRVNIIADKLFHYLNEKFTFDEVSLKFVLTGKTAAILQGHGTSPSSNVVFYTNNKPIYDFLIQNVEKFINSKTCIKFKERILLDFDFVKIELWYQSGGLDSVQYNSTNIYLHTYPKIPVILL